MIGSNNREKARIKLTKAYEKLVNQRNDFLHKLSRFYVNNYDIICVENLNIKGMSETIILLEKYSMPLGVNSLNYLSTRLRELIGK